MAIAVHDKLINNMIPEFLSTIALRFRIVQPHKQLFQWRMSKVDNNLNDPRTEKLAKHWKITEPISIHWKKVNFAMTLLKYLNGFSIY